MASADRLHGVLSEMYIPIRGIMGIARLLPDSCSKEGNNDCISARSRVLVACISMLYDMVSRVVESTRTPSQHPKITSVCINTSVERALSSLSSVTCPGSGDVLTHTSYFIDPSLPSIVACDEKSLLRILVWAIQYVTCKVARGTTLVCLTERERTGAQLVITFTIRGVPATKLEQQQCVCPHPFLFTEGFPHFDALALELLDATVTSIGGTLHPPCTKGTRLCFDLSVGVNIETPVSGDGLFTLPSKSKFADKTVLLLSGPSGGDVTNESDCYENLFISIGVKVIRAPATTPPEDLHDIDIVCIDGDLPTIDAVNTGLRIDEALMQRVSPTGRHPIFVLLSSQVGVPSRKRRNIIRAVFDAILVKPLLRSNVASTLSTLLTEAEGSHTESSSTCSVDRISSDGGGDDDARAAVHGNVLVIEPHAIDGELAKDVLYSCGFLSVDIHTGFSDVDDFTGYSVILVDEHLMTPITTNALDKSGACTIVTRSREHRRHSLPDLRRVLIRPFTPAELLSLL